MLSRIIDCVHRKNITIAGSDIYIEAITMPQYVSIDDKGSTIYTATIRAVYSREVGFN